jgi:glycosyltransferase involved in cell wall biosynthesis
MGAQNMADFSIVMAAHNEGDLLWKTVQSCRETCAGLDYEIVVADDASEDDCIEQLKQRFPEVTVCGCEQRLGPSPTKDRAAEHARGEVLVFLDAHCKPEARAILQLVNDVRETAGEAIVTPTIVCLQPETWSNDFTVPGQGYLVELDGVTWRWIPTSIMRPRGRFFESPSLIGCGFAMSKWLYEKLWGFDRNMYMWGVEDVDLGVKSWLLDHPVLHDPVPVIGHRFQKAFTTYKAPKENLIANQLRMAYKVLSPQLWREWLSQFRPRQRANMWQRAWDIFTVHRGTAEVERVYLAQRQKLDVVSYARRFGLAWPLPPMEVAASDGAAAAPMFALSE